MNEQAGGDAERILIADDDQSTREFLGDLLAKEGYECEMASDGTEVLRRLVKFDPALVISDVRMPGLNGLQLLRLVRQHFPETSIIIITGYGTREDAAGIIEQGASDYVLKPLGLPRIRASVRSALDSRRARLNGQAGPDRAAAVVESEEGEHPLLPPDLRAVVEAWPFLPDTAKADIVAMVKKAGSKCQ